MVTIGEILCHWLVRSLSLHLPVSELKENNPLSAFLTLPLTSFWSSGRDDSSGLYELVKTVKFGGAVEGMDFAKVKMKNYRLCDTILACRTQTLL